MRDVKRTLVTGFTSVAVLAAVIGIYVAIHSPLFLVQVVEVADQPENAPVEAQAITQLAAVPTGIVNLFDLDLQAVEKRLLSDHWIKEVRLQKRFPQTLSVSVVFREPRAIYQYGNGTLGYVDSEGMPFGKLNLLLRSDLPLLSGFSADAEGRGKILAALKILDAWNHSPLRGSAQISTLSWNSHHGFRALIAYPMGQNHQSEEGLAQVNRPMRRAFVDLGEVSQEIDDHFSAQFTRLSEVIQYLSGHSIPARQIFADVGKKIVVKTSRGS